MSVSENIIDHPDFVQIAAAIAEGDDAAEKHLDAVETGKSDPFAELRAMHESLVNVESLYVASRRRAASILHDIPAVEFAADPLAVVSAIWSDAFLLGVRFQQLGGHAA